MILKSLLALPLPVGCSLVADMLDYQLLVSLLSLVSLSLLALLSLLVSLGTFGSNLWCTPPPFIGIGGVCSICGRGRPGDGEGPDAEAEACCGVEAISFPFPFHFLSLSSLFFLSSSNGSFHPFGMNSRSMKLPSYSGEGSRPSSGGEPKRGFPYHSPWAFPSNLSHLRPPL